MPTLTEISQQQKDREEDALRIEFAKAALTGYCASDRLFQGPSEIAHVSWGQADAMIEAMKAARK